MKQVATASTKSSAGKSAQTERESSLALEAEESGANAKGERTWQIACFIILALASALRLYQLTLKPAHHDEGVNGFFFTRLFRDGVYIYDPANYHGPTLYYFTLPLTYLFGLNTFTIRLVTVVFGVGTIWLVLTLRKYIGTVGSLAAAAFLAFSPGAVFLSRYYIHEMLFVFFTVGIVVAALKFYETAESFYLILCAVSAALLFATKETAFITVGVLLIAFVSTHIYMRFAFGRETAPVSIKQTKKSKKQSRADSNQSFTMSALAEKFGGRQRLTNLALISVAAFLIVYALFYTSFFTNSKGLSDSLAAFKIWTKTGESDFHRKPFDTYFNWLYQEESPLLILGAAGTLLSLLFTRNRFAIFTALWAFGILLAYSLVPYKTPWLTLNIILPLAIISGFAIDRIYELKELGRQRIASLLFAAIFLALQLYQTIQLNFIHYDEDTYIYVYAHTQRGFLNLIDEIERISNQAGTGNKTGIAVVSPDYWPMPWYLRDYPGVGYWGHVQTPTNEALVIANQNQEAELQPALGGRYNLVGTYPLRPGVTLELYARNGLTH